MTNSKNESAFFCGCGMRTCSDCQLARPVPVVGMGCTYSIGSDQYPVTIVAIERNGRAIVVTRDRAVGPNMFLVNPEGKRETFTLRGTGRYQGKGNNYTWLTLGRRTYSLDPGF
jgi:hypothetical protein